MAPLGHVIPLGEALKTDGGKKYSFTIINFRPKFRPFFATCTRHNLNLVVSDTAKASKQIVDDFLSLFNNYILISLLLHTLKYIT